MSCVSGTNTVNDGLVFSYDINNTVKSWKGKPTTNYAYNQNPRVDTTYSQWEPTGDATWTANHSGRLVVYNEEGTAITGYINSGVNSGNWTVTHHAYWIYDEELKKPVVIMRDLDAQWKAKNWNTGQSMTSMGLGAGDTYTISWLQWTTNIGKSANAGLYGQNTSGQNGFHDGMSNAQSSTAYNTKPYTWQRVYATFTVDAIRNMGATLSCYMYGYYGGRGVIKISDVQIEPGVVSGFSKAQNRSNTEALIDISGQSTLITTNSLTYNSDNTFEFDRTQSDFINIADPGYPATWADPYSFEAVVYIPSSELWYDNTVANSGTVIVGRGGYAGAQMLIRSTTENVVSFFRRSDSTVSSAAATIGRDAYYYIVGTYDGAGTGKIYVNGLLQNTTAGGTDGVPDSGVIRIGGSLAAGGNTGGYASGRYPIVKMYNKELSPTEVKQNFEATRGLYGI